MDTCPLCGSEMTLFGINLHESVFLCSEEKCVYPFGYEEFLFTSDNVDEEVKDVTMDTCDYLDNILGTLKSEQNEDIILELPSPVKKQSFLEIFESLHPTNTNLVCKNGKSPSTTNPACKSGESPLATNPVGKTAKSPSPTNPDCKGGQSPSATDPVCKNEEFGISKTMPLLIDRVKTILESNLAKNNDNFSQIDTCIEGIEIKIPESKEHGVDEQIKTILSSEGRETHLLSSDKIIKNMKFVSSLPRLQSATPVQLPCITLSTDVSQIISSSADNNQNDS